MQYRVRFPFLLAQIIINLKRGNKNICYICKSMKYLFIILSLYIVGLTVLPCADDIRNMYDSVAFHDDCSDNTDGSGSATTDDCSPFCSCACCGVSLNYIFGKTHTLVQYNQYSIEKNILYKRHIKPGFSAAVFQPPKFVV